MALLQEGTIFAARYRILRRLATGGMGEVYEAVHLETERRRALKVMHAHLFQSEVMRERSSSRRASQRKSRASISSMSRTRASTRPRGYPSWSWSCSAVKTWASGSSA